jgi:hypothetical protein
MTHARTRTAPHHTLTAIKYTVATDAAMKKSFMIEL